MDIRNIFATVPYVYGSVLEYMSVDYGLNICIDIQTSKTYIQVHINKMITIDFLQWRVST